MPHAFLPTAAELPAIGDTDAASRGLEEWCARIALEADDSERARLEQFTNDPQGRHLLRVIFGNSTFLGQCLLVEPLFLLRLVALGPDDCLAGEIDFCRDTLARESDRSLVARELRQARRRIALLTALADIAGYWSLEQVTGGLSDFADAALDAALAFLLRQAHEREELTLSRPDNPLENCGLCIVAMGKYGARELNYSSDIDIIVLFDPERIAYQHRRGVQDGMVRLTRDLARLIDERTGDGYVFRTDFRLRPDPGATPLAMSVHAALVYYESSGQNWERAAMIKARAAAGDIALGNWFLRELRPFVWRKHLDFWAIQDIHSIKRQIHAQKGGSVVAVEGHNVKLGRGGIREIEFFCQTQQLIFGGRDASLRDARTLEALPALVAAARVDAATAEELAESYRFLRQLEHRLQMVEDQQTHSLPGDEAGIARIAGFMGFESSDAFRRELIRHLRQVENHYAELFEEAPSLSGPGNLVFTGGEPEPGTLETLEKLGFKDGTRVFNMVRAWHHGRYRSTRSTRARELLTELMPHLLEELSKTRDPDAALSRFDAFIAALPAGVQLFALLYQNPGLLKMVAEIMGLAPALAEHLGRRPNLLEAVLDPDFFDPIPAAETLAAELSDALAQARDFQDMLDAARRWTNDRKFQVGVQILRHSAGPDGGAAALSDIAEVVIRAILDPVRQELEAAHGCIAGSGLAVLALGKLGGQEMTVTSDLDLVFVYRTDADDAESDGRKPLPASVYYGRLAQRFITALSALTGEGRLYEVDPRLRPSGAAGPIALSLAGFIRYQEVEAWTWEHMALTRARAVAGEPSFAQEISSSIRQVLTRPRDPDRLLHDVAEMRRRIEREFPARTLWDLKYLRGGLYDIDFIAQYLQLRHAHDHPDVIVGSSQGALRRLAELGLLARDRAELLASSAAQFNRILNYLRLTVGEAFDETAATQGLRDALARAGGVEDLEKLKDDLTRRAESVMRCYNEIIEEPAQQLGETVRPAGDNAMSGDERQ